MSDNNENVDQDKTPEGPLQTDHGTTTIEENVVAKIAGMAARQVPGVYGMGNDIRSNIIDQIEGTTGLEVVEVNIDVTDVHLPEEETNTPASTDLK